MENTIVVRGTLRGMGCEVACTLIATRGESANPANTMFTRCAILDAPLCLPDGYFEAIFCGQSAFLHRLNGVWSLGVPWRQYQPESSQPAELGRIIPNFLQGSMEPLAK